MNAPSSSTIPTGSFMKEPRAQYRMRGGKLLGLAALLLIAMLVALIVQIDTGMVRGLLPQRIVGYVLIDLAALLILMAYAVSHRATILMRRAHDAALGTRLQSRIIVMFSLIAIFPTLIVALFSILFFNVGVKSWFDGQVAAALEDSVTVATAYIEEHKDAIRNDALSLGEAMHNEISLVFSNPQLFGSDLESQSSERNLSEAIVFDRSHVLARTALSFSLMFEQIAIFGDNQDKIQGVIKISSAPNLYLLVVRVVDPQVLQHMQAAGETVNQYHALQQSLLTIQKQFFLVFILVALLVLLLSLWAGMLLAVRLVEPLRALMAATERVRGGDYSIKVPEGRLDDEISNLGRTFNRMTGQLEAQRRDLMEANRLGDERRRFTEAVLSGVSAGIIALDSSQVITLHNRTALTLLGRDDIIRQPISTILPELADLMRKVQKKPERIAQEDIAITRDEKRAMLHVQVTAERFGDSIEGFIVTFDDITELVSAQRSAAWADVARRIAHEIKNPLTPITLSAERIRKKFAPTEIAEKESFERYLDTIARHVRDIGRMVEEFVAFARLPSAVFHEENLGMLIRKSVFSEQTVHADIAYKQTLPDKPVLLPCDEVQLGQALLNLLKNAAEALENVAHKKEIRIALSEDAAHITLTICDNGPGFPPDKIATLTEPYVTTRAKGTGLGLAIVKRTVEEHKGTIALSNPIDGGACVTITFAKIP
jgi:two-component system nitrogen regulation sensor histidine kinase NtrY